MSLEHRFEDVRVEAKLKLVDPPSAITTDDGEVGIFARLEALLDALDEVWIVWSKQWWLEYCSRGRRRRGRLNPAASTIPSGPRRYGWWRRHDFRRCCVRLEEARDEVA